MTLSAGDKYAPCLGANTVRCELGATATVNTTGDFNSHVIACEDMVRLHPGGPAVDQGGGRSPTLESHRQYLDHPPPPLQALASKVASPQAYQSVGLLYCALDTSTAGTYTVIFTASSRNSGRAAVQRTVVVQPSCSPGEKLCSDGTCGEDLHGCHMDVTWVPHGCHMNISRIFRCPWV